MSPIALALHLAFLLGLPIVVVGVINRTKAVWAGRKGQPLLQPLFDLARLLRKRPVYSTVATGLFRVGPLVVLASALTSGLSVPVLGRGAPLSFPHDFVAVAYLWGLGRMVLVLSALDTGSAFEGMGASREATFGALVEPALVIVLGTLGVVTGHTSFADMVQLDVHRPEELVVSIALVLAMLVILQVESARVPIDDPSTHLELTMVHEVMILDHSGPELAALQYAAAVRLTLSAAVVAALVNPVSGELYPAARWGANAAITLALAVVTGSIESLVARLKLRAVPPYIAVGLVAAFVALLAATLKQGHA